MNNLDEQIAQLEEELHTAEEGEQYLVNVRNQTLQQAEKTIKDRYALKIERQVKEQQRIRDKLFALKAEKAQIEMQDADVTDEEVPGEGDAWQAWAGPFHRINWESYLSDKDSSYRRSFRDALRIAIEADRKQRPVITQADLKKAAEKSCGLHSSPGAWDRLPDKYRDEWIDCIHTAFESAGIKVEGKD